MSRIRLIMLSMLAVFAVGAVASASASAHEWLVDGSGVTASTAVTSSGSEFKLTVPGTTKKVKCSTVSDTGNVNTGGKGEATNVSFKTCTTNETVCKVKSVGSAPSGEVVVVNVPTLLVTNGTGVKDEFKGSHGLSNTQFVTLEFGEKVNGTKLEKKCSNYPETTEVVGNVSSNVTQEGTKVKLSFPEPELSGNTLEAFGLPATLVGNDTEEVSGHTLSFN